MYYSKSLFFFFYNIFPLLHCNVTEKLFLTIYICLHLFSDIFHEISNGRKETKENQLKGKQIEKTKINKDKSFFL